MSKAFINLLLLAFILILFELENSYAQYYGTRRKTCQYLSNGRIYRGPCPKKPRGPKKPSGKLINGYDDRYITCKTTDGIKGLCRSPAFCFSQYDNIKQYINNQCKQSNGNVGICCPKFETREPNVRKIPIRIPVPFEPEIPIHIIDEDISEAAEISQKVLREQFELERKLIRKGISQRRNSMEIYHQAFFGPPDPKKANSSIAGLIAIETSLQLAKKYKLSALQARDGLLKYTLRNTPLSQHCPKIPVCKKSSKYRTPDGSCNNLRNPQWGMSMTQFNRLVPPAYADGLNELRISIDGSQLPGPRQVSRALAIDRDIPDKKFSLLVMQWGQFMDHDLTLTASTRAYSGEGLDCCNEEVRRSEVQHPACEPIIIPRNDPFYSLHNHFCNNFVRNSPGPRFGCNLGFREQTNTLTHIIDASMVYGSTDERARFLRSFADGKLRISKVNHVEFLPFDTENRSDECAIPSRRANFLHCFVGGDVRVNEQTGLTMLHTVLLREHNRIASVLQNLNPEWTDENIYQETRRIVAAVIQSITYNEWMPLILGRRVMKNFNLLTQPEGYTYDYDPSINPGILNEFATAAYRFHSLIQGLLRLLNNRGQVTQRIQLRNHFNNPESLYRRGAYDEFLNGYTANPTQTFDQHFTEDITNHLFQTSEENATFGMDLIALNIQRGRDHGLPGYNDFRKVCGMPQIKNFEALEKVMRPGSARIMARIYEHVNDIDLFIAGNHERSLPDAVVGPTFACILAEQARRNKVGDRFWFENGKMAHSFNEAQLNEIRKASLASLICANSDNIEKMQTLAFLQPLKWNPRIDCSKITRMNLKFWKGEKVQ